MGGFYYYGIDSLYIYLVVPAIIIMLWSQIRVKTVFSKYSTHHSPLTGADAARRVLEANGVYNVKIERVSGNLTDHYDRYTPFRFGLRRKQPFRRGRCRTRGGTRRSVLKGLCAHKGALGNTAGM